MQLETYISDLLYRYECVTIPEFGTFLTQRLSATIDADAQVFYPPKKVLSFNEQIQKSDGLLVRYIADVEGFPFEQANKKVAKHVRVMKSYLKSGKTLRFKDIGDLIFNTEGKITFEPAHRLNYLTDAFGLAKFECSPVANQSHKIEIETEKVIPLQSTQKRQKRRSIYLKYAAVATIALFLGGSVVSKYYIDQVKVHNELAQEQANQQLEAKIQEATFSLKSLPPITLKLTKQTKPYHIVAGAFRVEKNCDKKINQLKAQGFHAQKIGVNKYGLHQVAYASYETLDEALQSLRKIKRTQDRTAWLLVKK